MRRLILRNGQSPGDIVMLTAAVRDLKRALGAAVAVDVWTPCPALWENSPHLTPLADGAAGAEEIASMKSRCASSTKRIVTVPNGSPPHASRPRRRPR